MNTLVLFAVLAASSSPEAQTLLDSLPSIHVTGVGRSSAAPDKVDLFVQVLTEDTAIETAVSDNAARMSAVVAATRSHSIAQADVQLSGVSATPRNEYEANTNRVRRVLYTVRKDLVICLRKPERLDALLVDLGKAKAIVGRIDFASDALKASEEQLFVKAMESARKRAESMATAAGARLGRPLKVLTTREFSGGANSTGMATYSGAGGVSVGEAATGALAATISVAVDFELLPLEETVAMPSPVPPKKK